LSVPQERTIVSQAKSLRVLCMAKICLMFVRMVIVVLIATADDAHLDTVRLCQTDAIVRFVGAVLTETCLYVLLLRSVKARPPPRLRLAY
jgi:hypothetical protein